MSDPFLPPNARHFKRSVILESYEVDSRRFVESLYILQDAVEQISELGFDCEVEDESIDGGWTRKYV